MAGVLRRIPLVVKVSAGDLLLQLEDALEQRLGAWRAPGHVDVDRDDRVDALGDRVGVPVGAAGVGAGAERDDVLRLGHLVVEAPHGRRHLVGDRAGDDHQVGLPRTGRERDDPEADEVVPGHRRGDELDGAAGQAEVEHPERVAAAPVEDDPDRLGREVGGRSHPRHRQVGCRPDGWCVIRATSAGRGGRRARARPAGCRRRRRSRPGTPPRGCSARPGPTGRGRPRRRRR